MDQNKFLKQMQELVEFGRTKDNVLTKEEIADYCSDMSLTDKQLELVYAYVKEHQIHVPGYKAGDDDQEKESSESRKKGRL